MIGSNIYLTLKIHRMYYQTLIHFHVPAWQSPKKKVLYPVLAVSSLFLFSRLFLFFSLLCCIFASTPISLLINSLIDWSDKVAIEPSLEQANNLSVKLAFRSSFLFHRFLGNTNKWICRILEFRKKFLSLAKIGEKKPVLDIWHYTCHTYNKICQTKCCKPFDIVLQFSF